MSKHSKNSSISSNSRPWGMKILRQLSLEEKIGQMIMPAIRGSDFNKSRDIQFGGFILFEGGAYESVIVIEKLQASSKIPLLIGSDFERGANFRIHGTTSLPWNMAIGATQSEKWAYEQGKISEKDIIILAAFGAGFTWASAAIRW